jgi:sulfopyruvate decarboxylase TPP-binding subunit
MQSAKIKVQQMALMGVLKLNGLISIPVLYLPFFNLHSAFCNYERGGYNMITNEKLFSFFADAGIKFFTGVSDSCFAPMVNYLEAHEKECEHIIATNEGEALAISAGYHLSTGEIPVVYLQNDGFLNLMNPLTPLVDKYVYSIPALLLISWRGAPKRKDAGQHKRIGEIISDLLDLLDIPYHVYDGDNNKLRGAIEGYLQSKGREYAICPPIF